MKIAITGGTGFIGKWLVQKASIDNDIMILGRDKPEDIYLPSSVKYRHTDYSVADLQELLKGRDAVVHLAAVRMTDDVFEKYLPNMLISVNLFEACLKAGITNIVALSSLAVYSPQNIIPWTEEQRISPGSFYGISKAAMEQIADYYNKHGLAIKCLRVAQVLGLYERDGYMLNTFIKQAHKGETLQLYGEGKGRREYIYVKDVADAIMAALNSPSAHSIFNIGSGINMSNYELAILINDVFRNSDNIEFLNNLEEDKRVYLMNVEKAQKVLNWRAKWSMRDALVDMQVLMQNPPDLVNKRKV